MAYRLYTFPVSHYCEKARWALDYKGIQFQEMASVPIFHLFLFRKYPLKKPSVPFLEANGEFIQGSTEIIRWLEGQHPRPSLMEFPPGTEALVQEMDTKLDKIGIHVRRYLYWLILPQKAEGKQALAEGVGGWQRRMVPILYPLIQKGIFKGLNINADSAQRSRMRLQEGLRWLERTLGGNNFLLGDHFTFLDMAAASLLAPVIYPTEHPVYSRLRVPQEVEEALHPFRKDPILQWVEKIYRQYRDFQPK